MPTEVFTHEWALAWGEELRVSDAYRDAAGGWEGAIALVMEADPDLGIETDRAVLLDLWHGECRDARRARETDLEQAPFLLRARAAVWRRVLRGEVQPLLGVTMGTLQLERGSLTRLLPYTTAAKEMVAAAGRVETTFPEGWGTG